MRCVATVGLVSLSLLACDGRLTESEPQVPAGDALLRQEIARWGVIPMGAMPNQDAALVALGRNLFFDKILSGNRDISCASCHQPSAALGDGIALAVGTGAVGTGLARRPGPGRTFVARQSPSLLNAGLGMFYLFWDGRLTRFGHELFGNEPRPVIPTGLSHALVGQAMVTVLNRREMRGNAGDRDVHGNPNELAQLADDQSSAVWQAIMQRLTAIPEYVQLFSAAFPGRSASQLGFEDAARAITAFELQAFTKTNTAFDRYLNRDDAALNAEEKRGASLFFGRAQCASCHGGPFLGGQSFTNIGAPQIGPGAGRQLPLDLGRGELQNNDFYRFAFRAPPLRNVELTAPYMHSGAYATLDAVVEHYKNVPKALREYDASQLPAELRALYHGDDATINAVLANLDTRVRTPLVLTDAEKSELVAFMKALTDPAAKDLRALEPARVPSGLPVEQ
jgi:cytochrome c peroxidase